MKGIHYAKTIAAKGSQLHDALVNEHRVAVKRIYAETTARFDAIYPLGDRQWFENWTPHARHWPDTADQESQESN